MKSKFLKAIISASAIFVAGAAAFSSTAANADSCWNHNGSIMRLKASGQSRWFYYEAPRGGLAVRSGTLLFNGRNLGGYYTGTARVFSRFCPSNPLEYRVEGPVSNGQKRVVMRGTRQVYRRCQPTGRYVTDTLVFNYAYQC